MSPTKRKRTAKKIFSPPHTTRPPTKRTKKDGVSKWPTMITQHESPVPPPVEPQIVESPVPQQAVDNSSSSRYITPPRVITSPVATSTPISSPVMHPMSQEDRFDELAENLARYSDQRFQAFADSIHDKLDSLVTNAATSASAPLPTPQEGNNSDLFTKTIKVGSHLSPRLRAKIMEGDLIEDLRCLLPEQPSVEEQFTLALDQSSGSPVFVSAPKKKTVPISVLEWSRSWNIYQTVLVDMKHDLASIAKHCDVVLALASKGYNWRFYDVEFRREIMKGNVSWGQVHLELLNEAKSKRHEVSLATSSMANNQGESPNRHCFNYYHKGYCRKNPCPFPHIKKPVANVNYGNSFRQPFRAPANWPFRAPASNPFRFAAQTTTRPLSMQHGYRRPFKKVTHPY